MTNMHRTSILIYLIQMKCIFARNLQFVRINFNKKKKMNFCWNVIQFFTETKLCNPLTKVNKSERRKGKRASLKKFYF